MAAGCRVQINKPNRPSFSTERWVEVRNRKFLERCRIYWQYFPQQIRIFRVNLIRINLIVIWTTLENLLIRKKKLLLHALLNLLLVICSPIPVLELKDWHNFSFEVGCMSHSKRPTLITKALTKLRRKPCSGSSLLHLSSAVSTFLIKIVRHNLSTRTTQGRQSHPAVKNLNSALIVMWKTEFLGGLEKVFAQ